MMWSIKMLVLDVLNPDVDFIYIDNFKGERNA